MDEELEIGSVVLLADRFVIERLPLIWGPLAGHYACSDRHQSPPLYLHEHNLWAPMKLRNAEFAFLTYRAATEALTFSLLMKEVNCRCPECTARREQACKGA